MQSDTVESWLARAWCDATGKQPDANDATFVAAGGDAMGRVRLEEALHACFGLDGPLPADIRPSALRERLGTALPRPARAPVPGPALTALQTAWWLTERAPLPLSRASTHTVLEVDAEGVEPERLETAWRAVVQAHPVLRNVVQPDGSVARAEELPAFELHDRRAADVQAALAELRAAHIAEDLPLAGGVPWRIALTSLPQGRTRIHVRYNFAWLDHASMYRVLRDWGAAVAGRALPSAEQPPLDRHSDPQLAAASRAWWETTTLPPPPRLPIQREPASLGRPSPRRIERTWDSAARDALTRHAAAHGLALASAVQAAFGLALATWSAMEPATLSIAVFERSAVVDATSSGDACQLALAALPAPVRQSFAEYGRSTESALLDALRARHDGVLARARKTFQAEGNGYPIVFTDLLRGADPGGFDGATAWLGRRAFTVTRTPQVWLDCMLRPEAGGIAISWDHPHGLFDPDLLGCFFTSFCALVTALADGVGWDTAVDLLAEQMLPASQRAARASVNATESPCDARTLAQLVLEQAERTPDALAVLHPDRTLLYAELVAEARGVAGWLHMRGITPGALVGVWMHKGWEEVVAVLGVHLAGGVYMPIDASMPQSRAQVLLERGAPGWIVTQPGVEVDAGLRPVLRIGEAPLPPSEVPCAARPDDLAYVLFTSGSTGVPKGVMIGQRGAVNTVTDVNERFALGPLDRIYANSALSFDLSVYDIFGPLTSGGALVLPATRSLKDPRAWVDDIKGGRVTVWNSVPMALEILLDMLESTGEPFPDSVRLVLLSGDWIPLALPGRLRRALPNALVVSLGGATEASIWSCIHVIDEVPAEWKSVPYGKPLRNQRLHVLHENHAPCPDGVPGELYIAGEGVAAGYLSDPERTARSFFDHPRTGERLYRTGDFARYFPDGVVEFLGRRDAQVKIHGYRVELGELESAACTHPTVRAAAARTVGDRDGRRRLLLYVVPRAGTDADPTQLRVHLERILPEHMVPSQVLLIAEIPLSSNGKVDRAALPLPTPPTAASRDADDASSWSAMEQALAAVWCELLGVPSVGREVDFFELGGDSLLAIQVSSRLARRGISLSAAAFFERRTISRQAEVAHEAPVAATPGPEAVVGETVLGPGQRAFLELRFGEQDAWSEGFVLDAARPLDPSLLERALAIVVAHHPATRARLRRSGEAWVQVLAAAEPRHPMVHVTLTGSDPTTMAEVTRRLEGTIALAAGPVFSGALVSTASGDHVVLAGHQLVIDGFSWRILLEDLQTAYVALERGEVPELPAVHTSFRAWTRLLADYASTSEALAERDRWVAETAGADGGVPRDMQAPPSAETIAYMHHRLDADTTSALLRGATRRLGVTVQELLLGALATTLRAWTGRSELLVDVLAHGREPVVPDTDLSRTVGRMTTSFPLALTPTSTMAGSTEDAARRLRAVPLRGVRHGALRYCADDPAIREQLARAPAAAVSFNYVGQFDGVLGDAPLFTALHDLPKTRALVGTRRHDLELHTYVMAGRLTLEWRYSRSTHTEATLTRLTDTMCASLLAEAVSTTEVSNAVLVLGGTGALGRKIVAELLLAGHSVVALVRDPGGPKARALASQGVRLVPGDLADRDAVRRALLGCRSVVFSATGVDCKTGTGDLSRADRIGFETVLEEGEARGVEGFVYISMSGGIQVHNPMLDTKRAAEARLRRSGIPYTILRPTFYFETWFFTGSGIDPEHAHAKLYDGGLRAVSYIAQADVARAACRALDNEAARNRVIELGGPQAIAPRTALDALEAAHGRPFAVEEVNGDHLRVSAEAVADPVLRSVLALRAAHALGDAVDPAWSRSLGVELTSLDDWMRARGATPPASST